MHNPLPHVASPTFILPDPRFKTSPPCMVVPTEAPGFWPKEDDITHTAEEVEEVERTYQSMQISLPTSQDAHKQTVCTPSHDRVVDHFPSSPCSTSGDSHNEFEWTNRSRLPHVDREISHNSSHIVVDGCTKVDEIWPRNTAHSEFTTTDTNLSIDSESPEYPPKAAGIILNSAWVVVSKSSKLEYQLQHIEEPPRRI